MQRESVKNGGVSAFLAAQTVVQVLVFGIADGFVDYADAVQPGDGFHSLLSGQVVVEVAMDVFVAVQRL